MGVVMAACAGFTVSSCDLDMLPLNDVVLENYWTDATDVENVINSCYQGLQENDVLTRLIVWGEVRSDNAVAGQYVSDDIKNLINGNLLSTNSQCDWGGLYTVINRCNTVLEYAPSVAEKDPNYTESDLRADQVEVKTLRALCYFYLVRTFNNVPFSFEASIDDNQNYVYPASSCANILDSLIEDLDSIKDNGVRMYTSKSDNRCRITRAATYSVLADMCLWRASDADLDAATQQEYYERCIEYCDYVIDYKRSEYDADTYGEGLSSSIDTYVYTNYGYPLLAEDNNASAFNEIFAADAGQSFESIFELDFDYDGSSSTGRNYNLALMYGGWNSSSAAVQEVRGSADALMSTTPVATYSNSTLFTYYDYRSLTSFAYDETEDFDILKYTQSSMSISNLTVGSSWNGASLSHTSATNEPWYANWIFYRLSDIMLMRAEAEVQLAGLMSESASGTVTSTGYVEGSTLASATDLYNDAFNIVSAVFLRSNPDAANVSTARPQRENFTTLNLFENLVEAERHREFLFEGKRYYDLVRRARREGNTTYFTSVISSKFTDSSTALRIKMAMMDFMYMPYSETQLDLNPYLTQNAAYATDEDVIQN